MNRNLVVYKEHPSPLEQTYLKINEEFGGRQVTTRIMESLRIAIDQARESLTTDEDLYFLRDSIHTFSLLENFVSENDNYWRNIDWEHYLSSEDVANSPLFR